MKECDSRKDYRWQEGVELPELEEEILYSREEKFTNQICSFLLGLKFYCSWV